ncbi:hypothetical protein E2C01_039086 [Portunus trituberculatus]|uniref:Uncharacterized protein n=1 Tax=Portunus trituberculatus TaxID=210409 RepID=A0A5B7FK79_PORTR|nr:hypothetical protein [Portunus trituberculatus]
MVGILWDLEKDAFTVWINILRRPETRRGLLSRISSIRPTGDSCPKHYKSQYPVLEQMQKRVQVGRTSGRRKQDLMEKLVG